MNCPACGSRLKQVDTGSVAVDACFTCGGVWFDRRELERHCQSSGDDTVTLPTPNASANARVDSVRRGCPHCRDSAVLQRRVDTPKGFELYECRGCGGFWVEPKAEELVSRDKWQSCIRSALRTTRSIVLGSFRRLGA
ncbi:MAG: zf-TFIIB domain-containing protein [Planctomycetota bacterium]